MSATLLPPAPTNAPARSPAPPRTARGTRVLVVEDEPLTAEVFARSLAREGHLVEVARDGMQALRHLADGVPSLVVLDMSLPTGSGVDVVRRVREAGHTKLPIVVVSGSPRHHTALADRELWPGTWLEKPVKPKVLVQVVADFLNAT